MDPIGYRKALAVILPRKGNPKRAAVLALVASLPVEEIADAQKAFHRQGPGLWRWWCAGIKARKAVES